MPTATSTTRTPRSRAKAAATSTAAVRSTTADDLAGEVDRVLKISQPKVAAATTRTATATKTTDPTAKPRTKPAAPSAPTASSSTRTSTKAAPAPAASSSRTRTAAAAAPAATTTTTRTKVIGAPSSSRAPTSSRPRSDAPREASARVDATTAAPRRTAAAGTSRPTTTVKTSTLGRTAAKAPSRGQAPERPKPKDLPEWAIPESILSPRERTKACVISLNETGTALVSAFRDGFRWDEPPPAEWPLRKVEDLIKTAEMGIAVLRGLADKQQLQGRGLDAEKAAVTLVQRWIQWDQYDKALAGIAVCRQRLLAATGLSGSDRSGSGSTSIAPFLPYDELRDAEDMARTLAVQLSMLYWICHSQDASGAQDIAHQFPLPHLVASASPSHALHLALLIPQAPIYSAVGLIGRKLPSSAAGKKDWRRVSTLTILSIITATSAVPADGPAWTSARMWENLLRIVRVRVKSGDAPLRQVVQVIADAVTWTKIVVAARKEDVADWCSGESWTEVIDLWVASGKQLGDKSIIDAAMQHMGQSHCAAPATSMASCATNPPSAAASRIPETPKTAGPSRAVPAQSTARKLKPPRVVRKPSKDPVADATRFVGELSSLEILLKKQRSEPSSSNRAACISALKAFNMVGFSDAICVLPDDQAGVRALDRAMRYLAYPRHQCSRLISEMKGDSNQHDLSSNPLVLAMQGWIVAAVDLFEDLLQGGSRIPLNKVKEQVTDMFQDLQTGLTDLARLPPTDPVHKSSVLAYLNRCVALSALVRPFVPLRTVLEIGKYVASMTFIRATEHWQAERPADALPFAQLAVDTSREMLRLSREVEREGMSEEDEEQVRRIAHDLQDIISKRWELLAFVCMRVEEWTGMMTAFGHSLAALPRATYDKLAALLPDSTAEDVAAADPIVQDLVRRTARCMLAHADKCSGEIDRACNVDLPAPEYGPVYGIILVALGEKVVRTQVNAQVVGAAIASACFKRAEELCVGSRVVLARVMLSSLYAVCETGVGLQMSPALFSRAEQCIAGIDERDLISKRNKGEFEVTLLLLRACLAYHIHEDPREAVAKNTTMIVTKLRGLVLPPTPPVNPASPAAKRSRFPLARDTNPVTPKPGTRSRTVSDRSGGPASRRTGRGATRQVSDSATADGAGTAGPGTGASTAQWRDLPRLAELLWSVVALLGMLGMRMPRVELLKVARAVLRGHDQERAGAEAQGLRGMYVEMSGLLGSEYASLGKWTRARVVLEAARRMVLPDDGDGHGDGDHGLGPRIGEETVVRLRLRWCAFLAQTGRVDEAKAEFEAVSETGRGMGNLTEGSFAVRVMSRIDESERIALARMALAAIAEAEGDMASVAGHLLVAHRVCCRRADYAGRAAPDLYRVSMKNGFPGDADAEGKTGSCPVSPASMPVERQSSYTIRSPTEDPFVAVTNGQMTRTNGKKQRIPGRTGPSEDGDGDGDGDVKEGGDEGAAAAAAVGHKEGHAEANADPPVDPADEPAHAESVRRREAMSELTSFFVKKHMMGVQWAAAHEMSESLFNLATLYALRGTAQYAQHYMDQIVVVARCLRAEGVVARAEARTAALNTRLRRWDVSAEALGKATAGLKGMDGPDVIEARVVQGDLLSKQEAAHEALEAFIQSGKEIEGIDDEFLKAEGLVPTPKKTGAKTSKGLRVSLGSTGKRDPILPAVMAHVLRQRVWLSGQAVAVGGKTAMVQGAGGGGDEMDGLLMRVQALGLAEGQRVGFAGNGLRELGLELMQQAEEMLLQGKMGMMEVMNAFKADLFTSSLTESTIALPMSSLSASTTNKRTSSARQTVHTLLARAESAYSSALELSTGLGKAEDVRHAGVNLALLHAFRSSLGHGGAEVTRAAADLLVSTSSVTLHRELLEVIDSKFVDGPREDTAWPGLVRKTSTVVDSPGTRHIRAHWSAIRSRPLQHAPSGPIDLSPLPSPWAVVSLSVSDDRSTLLVTRHQRDVSPIVLCLPFERQGRREMGLGGGPEDEADEAGLSFDAARESMREIISASDETARKAKTIKTDVGRREWWDTRYDLNKRLGALLKGMEEGWFGAFKSVFASQDQVTPEKVALLRTKIERVFTAALLGAGTDMKRAETVRLDDAILACFATLEAGTGEDEVEDLVYFVLDVYGFHGVPVAVAELDVDQIVVDIKSVLAEINSPGATAGRPASSQGHTTASTKSRASKGATDDAHVFLILDKHAQAFPWESMPCLRGKSASRVPSLPFLLDQLRLARLTSCRARMKRMGTGGMGDAGKTGKGTVRMLKPSEAEEGTPLRVGSKGSASSRSRSRSRAGTARGRAVSPDSDVELIVEDDEEGAGGDAFSEEAENGVAVGPATMAESKFGVDARKVYYVLNPSADLANTQQHFEPWLAGMREKAGWRGVQGRAVTELEMAAALKECDMFLYFGHGGAEQYMRSHKLRALHRCAVTMLWGCSSGSLRDQGDLDAAGTAWSYMMAGCPSLVANLWDVTDRDIDRLSEAVLQNLHLDTTHLHKDNKEPGLLPLCERSVPQALNGARDECKLRYLTGAAPVCYGLPVWMF